MRQWLFIVCMSFILGVRASDVDGMLPRFEQITVEDGLNDNGIRHILQLSDGRMVVTTRECFNVLDGREVQRYSMEGVAYHPLSNYHGSYHVYADNCHRLWLKDDGRIWCFDQPSGRFADLAAWQMDDFFVDDLGRTWLLTDTTLSTENKAADTFALRREWGELQDVEADSLRLYLFFSPGTVACYDLESRSLEYISQPYDTAEAKFYEQTSLVKRSPEGRFYQLRCGRQRNIFLMFNPDTREWNTVFETTQGSFHTLCIPTSRLALMTCPEGLWEIDLETGQMQLHSEVITQAGDTLHTGFNTVFCDRHGGLWLGSFYDGLLYSPTIHASRTYLIYYIVISLAVVLALIIGLFVYYAHRMRRRELRLMERLRELVEEKATVMVENPPTAEAAEMPETTDVLAPADPFIQRCSALVEQNLNTPGYSVERLAADLCMERTGLYKKLTALLDQTPTLFIRSIRMEKAARLLREKNLSVTEVAERTGFSSASYFSRLFYETYGCKPSEYGKTTPQGGKD